MRARSHATAILDFLSVAVAGSREPLTEILVNEIVKPEGSSQAGLIGRMQRASRLSAALVNGAAADALDFDDTHTAMGGHPSVPVIPAVLALADGSGLSGREVLEALLIGIELECRLGALIGAQHYAIGSLHRHRWNFRRRCRMRASVAARRGWMAARTRAWVRKPRGSSRVSERWPSRCMRGAPHPMDCSAHSLRAAAILPIPKSSRPRRDSPLPTPAQNHRAKCSIDSRDAS